MKQRDITAVIYCRLSKDDGGGDSESNSIGNQRDILNRYASEHGFVVKKEYVDDGWSGSNFERPNFKKMVEDIEAGGIGILLVKDLSRLGRNNAMIAFYTEIFLPDHDVRLIALGDNIDTGHGENELMAFKSVINEYYARDISRKIRAAKRNQALKGNFGGSHAPFGYIKAPDNNRKLIVDEDAASVVRRMFEMADNGLGTHQIARIISNDKILIPTVYKANILGLKSIQFDEEFPYDWRTTTVRRILESRVYIGDMVSHKQGKKSFKSRKMVRFPESEWIVITGTHEPLVSLELFERVQKAIKIKKRSNSAGIKNIFAGVLKCADCESNMTYKAYNKHSGCIGGSFLCNKYRHNSKAEIQRKTCTAHYVPYANIHDAVFSRLKILLSANSSENEIMQQIFSDKAELNTAQKQFKKLKHRGNDLERIIRKIVEQNALGEITPETFTKLYGDYIKEQNELSDKINALEAEIIAEHSNEDDIRLNINKIRNISHSGELSREMILDYTNKIVVHEPFGNRRKGTRQQTIEIHYRFGKV